MTDRDLELLLRRTASSLAYPPTPQLRAAVLIAIASDAPQAPSPATRRVSPAPAPRRPARRPAFAFATIAAALAAFAAMLALAIPSSRSAIAEFFGIEGSKIERLPTPPPGTTATPFPTPQSLPETARATTLTEVEAALGFPPAEIAGDKLEAAFLVDYGDDAIAILRYPAYDLWQSELASVVAQKELSEDVRLEEFELEPGVAARWVTGGRYVLVFIDDANEDVDQSFRVVERSTLIWRTEHAFYRIETTLSREDAVTIARSLP